MLQTREGQTIPSLNLMTRHGNAWQAIATGELFANKTVIVFSLPGAFTPTCSSSHLPRYNELAATFRQHGVDEIICVSVNDGFVMNEWAKDQDAANIRMLPDGNGEFTAAMGMLVDKSAIGFGKRSWRYSMLVRNGVIEKMFIEPEKEGDPFEVSDADTMLGYLAPHAKKPDQVVVLSKEGCPFCAKAKQTLSEHGYEYIDLPLANKQRGRVLGALTGELTAPQVFINGRLIGGSEALAQFVAAKQA